MTTPSDFLQPVKSLFTPQTDEEYQGTHAVRPFFFVVVLTVGGLWIYSLFSNPQFRTPLTFAVLTGLVLVHALLHWFTPILSYRPRTSLIYMIVQGILAFGIILILKDTNAILILYPMLIGETAGVVKGTWRRLFAGLSQLALMIAALSFYSGWSGITSSLWAILLVVGFVLPYVIVFTQQVKGRQQAQSMLRELETAHQALADYALQVEELTRAAERERIARELHDTLSQGLAGLILQLEAAVSHLEDDHSERALSILQNALLGARQALDEARRTIDTLRLSDTLLGDLRIMIQAEVNRFTGATGIPCTLDTGSLERLPELTHQHILRILVAALSNITRHSQAKNVTVSAHCAADQFSLIISDDGIGFEPDTIPAGHYGLLGMRERTRLMGASLDVQSAPGKGTAIKVLIPLDEGDDP